MTKQCRFSVTSALEDCGRRSWGGLASNKSLWNWYDPTTLPWQQDGRFLFRFQAARLQGGRVRVCNAGFPCNRGFMCSVLGDCPDSFTGKLLPSHLGCQTSSLSSGGLSQFCAFLFYNKRKLKGYPRGHASHRLAATNASCLQDSGQDFTTLLTVCTLVFI